MDDNFLTALFPGRHRVLGRALHPLSFWHLACLHAIGSPFVAGRDPDDPAEVGLKDIQLAVKICRTRWPQQPDLHATPADWALFHLLKNRASYVTEHASRFVFYKNAHERHPRFWENENEKPKTLSAPEILTRIASLERTTHFTHDQIWNDVSPGYSTWLIGTICEQEGAELRFVRPDDDEGTELPDLSKLSESELFEVIKADVGEYEARCFMNRRALNASTPQPLN